MSSNSMAPTPQEAGDANKYIAPGALHAMAGVELPAHLAAHLPQAELAAAANLAAVQAASAAQIAALTEQLERAQTPVIPRGAKIIRLRHIAAEWSQVFSEKTACRTGCNHCCHLDVMVPRSEAVLIGKAIGRKPVMPARTFNMEEAAKERRYFGEPCTFLKENRCSIYAHRPMVCRTLVNMDSVDLLCELVDGVEVPVPYLNTMLLKGYFAYCTQDEPFADVRDWFAP